MMLDGNASTILTERWRDGEQKKLVCWGLVEKGGSSVTECCYVAESPRAPAGSIFGPSTGA